MHLSLSTTEKHTQSTFRLSVSKVYFACNGGIILLSLPGFCSLQERGWEMPWQVLPFPSLPWQRLASRLDAAAGSQPRCARVVSS